MTQEDERLARKLLDLTNRGDRVRVQGGEVYVDGFRLAGAPVEVSSRVVRERRRREPARAIAIIVLPLLVREYIDPDTSTSTHKLVLGNSDGTFRDLLTFPNTAALDGAIVETAAGGYLVTFFALGESGSQTAGFYSPTIGRQDVTAAVPPTDTIEGVKGYIGIRNNPLSGQTYNLDIYDVADPSTPSASFAGIPRLTADGQFFNVPRPALATAWTNYLGIVPNLARDQAVGIGTEQATHVDADFNVINLTRVANAGGIRALRYDPPFLWTYSTDQENPGNNTIRVFKELVDLSAQTITVLTETPYQYQLPSDWQQRTTGEDILYDFYLPSDQVLP